MLSLLCCCSWLCCSSIWLNFLLLSWYLINSTSGDVLGTTLLSLLTSYSPKEALLLFGLGYLSPLIRFWQICWFSVSGLVFDLLGWLLVGDSASVKQKSFFVCFLNLNYCSVDMFSLVDEVSYACLLYVLDLDVGILKLFFLGGPRLFSGFLGGCFWKWFCGFFFFFFFFFPSCLLALTHSDRLFMCLSFAMLFLGWNMAVTVSNLKPFFFVCFVSYKDFLSSGVLWIFHFWILSLSLTLLVSNLLVNWRVLFALVLWCLVVSKLFESFFYPFSLLFLCSF